MKEHVILWNVSRKWINHETETTYKGQKVTFMKDQEIRCLGPLAQEKRVGLFCNEEGLCFFKSLGLEDFDPPLDALLARICKKG